MNAMLPSVAEQHATSGAYYRTAQLGFPLRLSIDSYALDLEKLSPLATCK